MTERPTSQLAAVSMEQLVDQSMRSTDPVEQAMTRPTAQMRTSELLELLDQVAPEEGVIDMHELEAARPLPVPARNKHIAPRPATNPGGERPTSRMPTLAPEAYDAPPRSRIWLIAAVASVLIAGGAVLAMI